MQNNFFTNYYHLFLHISWPFSHKISLFSIHRRQGGKEIWKKNPIYFLEQTRTSLSFASQSLMYCCIRQGRFCLLSFFPCFLKRQSNVNLRQKSLYLGYGPIMWSNHSYSRTCVSFLDWSISTSSQHSFVTLPVLN